MSNIIALIAHDGKKQEMLNLVKQHVSILRRYQLIAPENIAIQIQQEVNLSVQSILSPTLGGDIQIATQITTKEVAAVIFLLDTVHPQMHEPDIQLFLRACQLHDVPLAINTSTAKAILAKLNQTPIAHLIFNPVAGQGDPNQDLKLIRQLLKPQIQLKTVFTKPDINAGEQATSAIATGADLVIASGGDGTISAVAQAVMGTETPLGIIPRGTANAFSVALGIPTNIRGACETILAGTTKVVDAARCNNTPMLLLAGIGFEAETVERANREMKDKFGVLAYMLAGVQQLTEQEVFKAQIELDGVVSTVKSPAITIANVAPITSILAQGLGEVISNDSLLDVTIGISDTGAPKTPKAKFNAQIEGITALIDLFSSAIVKTPTQREDIVCLRTPRIKVTTDPPQKVVVDGEIIGTTPVEIECIPGGLTIFAPL